MDLNARGLLSLGKIRGKDAPSKAAAGSPVQFKTEEIHADASIPLVNKEESAGATICPTTKDSSEPSSHDSLLRTELVHLKALSERFSAFLEHFLSVELNDDCSISITDFLKLIGKEVMNCEDLSQNSGLIKDLLVLNMFSFLKCLEHQNWHWTSLVEVNLLRNFFVRDVVPRCRDGECKVLCARILLKLFALGVREGEEDRKEDFMLLFSELCHLDDFSAIFMWILVDLLSSEEMLPYLSGGTCKIAYYISGPEYPYLYDTNDRNLAAPSLLRFRPEPRSLKMKSRSGTSSLPMQQKRVTTVDISSEHAAANRTFAADVLWLCCETFKPKGTTTGTGLSNYGAKADSRTVKTSAHSAQPSVAHQDVSPASPPPDATGIALESPASPDLPEMRTFKTVDEGLPDKFRVEFKDSAMKISALPFVEVHDASKTTKSDDGSLPYLRKSLFALSGWHWLAVCMIDAFNPEEADKGTQWPEFRTVAFFNPNVHILNAVRKNPLWMNIVEMASMQPDTFVYYSPIIRPIFIGLFMHWTTSLEPVMSKRNAQAREQTLWLLGCLSKSSILHDPYCYLGNIVDFLAPHELSSIMESLWKVIKTYFPNPHKLLTIPEQEQDFRARQMAETDCLLKIRAITLSRLSSVGVYAKKFFLPARVPLEESRWYESTQSQESGNAPAPINASSLAKED